MCDSYSARSYLRSPCWCICVPDLVNDVRDDGKLEPKNVTVCEGLNSPVLPLFRQPFQMLYTSGIGLQLHNSYTLMA